MADTKLYTRQKSIILPPFLGVPMNTFSTLFLSITLIASSANAALDTYNLPNEVPTELQDKLAWGLFNLDADVAAEALDAGASPKVEFSQTSEDGETYTRCRNAYGFLHSLDGFLRIFDIPEEDGLSPDEYDALRRERIERADKLQLSNEVAFRVQQLLKLHAITAILITKGVSVDKKFNNFLGTSTMRNIVNSRAQHPPSHEDESPLITNLVSVFYSLEFLMWQHLQLLIEKYQPEVIE